MVNHGMVDCDSHRGFYSGKSSYTLDRATRRHLAYEKVARQMLACYLAQGEYRDIRNVVAPNEGVV